MKHELPIYRALMDLPIRASSVRFPYGKWSSVKSSIKVIQRDENRGYIARCHPITREMIVWRLR